MGPRSSIQALMLFNKQDNSRNWVPRKYELQSWVTLMPGSRGGHERDSKKYGRNSMEGAYKAKVLAFRLSPQCQTVTEVLVQHTYMWRQLDMNPADPLPVHGSNYLYPSKFSDWVDSKRLTGIISVMHAEIGEAQIGNRTHKELLHEGIFFYNTMYHPCVRGETFGVLEPMDLPAFDDPSWPLPDMSTTEAFRSRLRLDFLALMKPQLGSRATHLQWFLSINVMIDLFSIAHNIQKTLAYFIFKDPSEELLSSLMDDGWDSKISIGDDVVKCIVDRSSLRFKFHIGCSILYTNFQFNRERLINESQWEMMDQVSEAVVMRIMYNFQGVTAELEVGSTWTLSNVQEEIKVALGPKVRDDFSLWIIQDGHTGRKINKRNELNICATDVQLPKKLQVVPKLIN